MITRKELESTLHIMRVRSGRDLSIERAYGKPRIYEQSGKGLREVSPRLSSGDLKMWMDAWLEGFDVGAEVAATLANA